MKKDSIENQYGRTGSLFSRSIHWRIQAMIKRGPLKHQISSGSQRLKQETLQQGIIIGVSVEALR